MAVMPMQKVGICGMKKDRKAILEKLQSMEIMEISQEIPADEGFDRMDTLQERQQSERNANLADQALNILDQYVPRKQSLLSGLAGKRPVSRRRFEEAVSRSQAVIEAAADLVNMNKKIAENRAEILKADNQIESLKPWMALDVPMNYGGTARTVMLLGMMPAQTALEDVYRLIAEQAPETEAVDVHLLTSDKDAVYLALFCLREEKTRVEDALRAGGFARPSQLTDRTPLETKEALEARKKELGGQIDEIQERIREKADMREQLQLVSDYFRIRREKYEVLGSIPQSGQTFFVSGYVAKPLVAEIEREIGETFGCVVDVEDVGDDEDPPIILVNNGFSSSVEGVLESYSLPGKGEFDPTVIMSFFYVIFFGMMLSDAAYGAILAAGCFVLLKKFPGMSAGMRKSIRMFLYCGISTLVWGVLFGGYFGDVVDTVSRTFFGREVSVPALWFAPLDDPMKLLVYSLGFGIIHLFTGLGIKGYMLVKEGKIKDFFCDVVLWYMLLAGLILMLIPTEIFASIIQTEITFPPALTMLAKILAAAGAAGLILMSGRDSRNPALRLALGAYDLYNITGWLGDILSYSRLLALGLATGVIASVVNQMASIAGKGVVGAIIFAVIFVVGHTLNFGINLLGAYVHTNRLQFVEFFGKFYEGGGKAFRPFRSDTKYVRIQEDGESR